MTNAYRATIAAQAKKRRRDMQRLRRLGHTLQFIGDLYDISRERVRQILSRKPL